MLGINVKRGIETTFERVYASSGNRFKSVEVRWQGTTAGINYRNGVCSLIFPAISDVADISAVKFSQLVGYALHELGHAWFTAAPVWDQAVAQHGTFVGKLINGLEDPRIELRVIQSGYAANAATLFASLTNHILEASKTDSGYVHPDDKRNVPFQLAIEGRRLNGYALSAQPVFQRSKYRVAIEEALNAAHVAHNTEQIVEIALRLNAALQEIDEQEPPQEPPPDEPEDGDKPEQGDEPGEQGDEPGDQPGDKPGDGDEPGDGDQPGQGDEPGEGDTPGDQPGQPGEGDKPGDEPGEPGKGSSSGFGGERGVDPCDFISESVAGSVDTVTRPVLRSLYQRKISWRT